MSVREQNSNVRKRSVCVNRESRSARFHGTEVNTKWATDIGVPQQAA